MAFAFPAYTLSADKVLRAFGREHMKHGRMIYMTRYFGGPIHRLQNTSVKNPSRFAMVPSCGNQFFQQLLLHFLWLIQYHIAFPSQPSWPYLWSRDCGEICFKCL